MLWIFIFDLFSAVQGDFICNGQRLTIVTSCGDIVILPCNFSWRGRPPTSTYELVWQVRQRGADYVVHEDDMQSPANQQQNNMFTNRTSVPEGWSRHGNATLQIRDVTESDNGLYTCDLLTTRPFARKICTEVQLIVSTDSLNCGTNKSLTVTSGESVQLPCLQRPSCLLHNKREIHWRFKATNSETEQELPRLPSAEDARIKVHANGTLILQKVSSRDSGAYCCYLKGTEMCCGVHLHVSDVATEDIGPKPTLQIEYFALAAVPLLMVVGVALFSYCWYKRHQKQIGSSKGDLFSNCSNNHQQENITNGVDAEVKEFLAPVLYSENSTHELQIDIHDEDDHDEDNHDEDNHDTVRSQAPLIPENRPVTDGTHALF